MKFKKIALQALAGSVLVFGTSLNLGAQGHSETHLVPLVEGQGESDTVQPGRRVSPSEATGFEPLDLDIENMQDVGARSPVDIKSIKALIESSPPPDENSSPFIPPVFKNLFPNGSASPQDLPQIGDTTELPDSRRITPGDNRGGSSSHPPAFDPILQSFSGIQKTSFNPPDPTMAAGPSNLVLAVNSQWAVYSKTGARLFSKTFREWLSSAGIDTLGLELFDPRTLYDLESGRFFMIVTGLDQPGKRSYIFIAVSQSSDALGSWCIWQLNINLNGSTPTNNFADFPAIGVNTDGAYITANMFDFDNIRFNYAKLKVLNKSQLTGCLAVGGYDFWGLTNSDGNKAHTVQPAHSISPVASEYLVNSHTPLALSASRLVLWALDNPLGNPPTLSRHDITVPAYSVPPDAEQPGTTIRINTFDGRLLNAVHTIVNGSPVLWTTQTIYYGGLSAVRIYRIPITCCPVTGSVPVTYTASGLYYFNSSIMADRSGNLVHVFNRSGTSEYAGIRYGRALNGSWLTSVQLKAGEGINTSERWGDYAGSALDPSDLFTMWLFNEYNTTSTNVWGTWVGSVQ